VGPKLVLRVRTGNWEFKLSHSCQAEFPKRPSRLIRGRNLGCQKTRGAGSGACSATESSEQGCTATAQVDKCSGLETERALGEVSFGDGTPLCQLRSQACSSDKPHQRLLQPTVTPENRNSIHFDIESSQCSAWIGLDRIHG
jgi:hypothetical protein